MWDDPPGPDYPLITVPVLLLPAMPADGLVDDEAVTQHRSAVAKAAAALAHARVREYAGADHDLHAQHPVELATDLLALARERG